VSEKDMSFLGHIGELRGHLIRSILAIIIAAVIIGFNINWIMDHIFSVPPETILPLLKWSITFQE
jgi:sec-independent protein translocase protein TatC